MLITPRRVCASGVKQSVLSVVVFVVVCHKNKKICLMGDLEAKTISKLEDKDEIRRILAYVYLIECKAVLFSLFSDYRCRPPFKYGNGHAHSLVGRDIRTRIHDSNPVFTETRLKVQPYNRGPCQSNSL